MQRQFNRVRRNVALISVAAIALAGCVKPRNYPVPAPWKDVKVSPLAAEPSLAAKASVRSAQEWLDKSAEQYRGLTTYEERGIIAEHMGSDKRVSLAAWNLRYARDGGYQFRYDQHGFLGSYASDYRYGAGRPMLNNQRLSYRIWKSSSDPLAQSMWTVGKDEVEQQELRRAISGAFDVCGRTSGWVMSLLGTDYQLRVGALQLADAVVEGGANINGHACVVIAGNRPLGDSTERVRVFIDMESLLARRWEFQDTGPTPSLRVWNVRPVANPIFGESAFQRPDQSVWESEFGPTVLEVE
ncbi:MAG: hypothetical protein ACK5ZG_06940 [Phycisphaerae bacterium]|jgi:hypothetical protein